MTISSIYILNGQGKLLISRNYRGDVNESIIESFLVLISQCAEEDNVKPLVYHKACTIFFIKYNNLCIVATTKRNASALIVFSFLYKFLNVMKDYFEDVNEEIVQDNFVFLYELLDEVLDFGYPQITETRILKDYITQKSFQLKVTPQIPMAVTNAVSWRPDGLRYDKNEVFLDVIEAVNISIDAKGNVVRSEIIGTINMKVYLTGMPDLRLGLNEMSVGSNNQSSGMTWDDVKFHQCVRLARFEADGTIAFIPPDGAFELLSYRFDTAIKPLIQVNCSVDHYPHSRIEYRVRVSTHFKSRSTANGVEILIPAPADADSPVVKAAIGTVRYLPERGGIVWNIKSLQGGKEVAMAVQLRLPSVLAEQVESRPPINVKFEIPYFTTSGLQIRHLKISEKSGYAALPWVRYITRNGDYLIRM